MQRWTWLELKEMLDKGDVCVNVNGIDAFIMKKYIPDIEPVHAIISPLMPEDTANLPNYNPFTHRRGDRVLVNGVPTTL